MIAACVVLPIIGAFGLRNIWITLGAIVIDIILIYYLPNKKVDYEYVFVDGQIDFDRIVAGANRKNMYRTDLEKVEIVAPEGSHSLDHFNNLRMEDFSSGKAEDKHYIIVTKGDKGNERVRFTPSENLLEQMQMKAKSKIEY